METLNEGLRERRAKLSYDILDIYDVISEYEAKKKKLLEDARLADILVEDIEPNLKKIEKWRAYYFQEIKALKTEIRELDKELGDIASTRQINHTVLHSAERIELSKILSKLDTFRADPRVFLKTMGLPSSYVDGLQLAEGNPNLAANQIVLKLEEYGDVGDVISGNSAIMLLIQTLLVAGLSEFDIETLKSIVKNLISRGYYG